MEKKSIETEIDMARDVIYTVFRSIRYCEIKLHRHLKELAIAKAFLLKGGYSFTIEECVQFFRDHDNEEVRISSTDDIVKLAVGHLAWEVDYYEKALQTDLRKQSAAKALCQRFPELLLNEIQKEAIKDLEEMARDEIKASRDSPLSEF